MLTLPLASVDVSVERSSESLNVADTARSKRFGAASNSTSTRRVLAVGTLKTTLEEHEPALTTAGKLRLGVVDYQ